MSGGHRETGLLLPKVAAIKPSLRLYQSLPSHEKMGVLLRVELRSFNAKNTEI